MDTFSERGARLLLYMRDNASFLPSLLPDDLSEPEPGFAPMRFFSQFRNDGVIEKRRQESGALFREYLNDVAVREVEFVERERYDARFDERETNLIAGERAILTGLEHFGAKIARDLFRYQD